MTVFLSEEKVLVQAVMRALEVSESEALARVEDAREDFYERLLTGEAPDDILMEHFGLDPDYLLGLI